MHWSKALTATFEKAISLADALDTPGRAWLTGGSATWFGQSGQSYHNSDAAMGGELLPSGQHGSRLQTGPGARLDSLRMLRTEYQTSGKRSSVFSLTGDRRSPWNVRPLGNRDSSTCPQGVMRCASSIDKLYSYEVGGDGAWVDQFTVTPAPPATATGSRTTGNLYLYGLDYGAGDDPDQDGNDNALEHGPTAPTLQRKPAGTGWMFRRRAARWTLNPRRPNTPTETR
ncbi:MAG: hypothetical protein R3F19_12300 [Verrucomicrobiales bacterium]